MKKILSLFLVGVMIISMIPSAYATTNYTNGTQVIYNADVDNTESYTVTVPALLAPAGSGNVVAQGTWASNRKLVVTADNTVTLTNSLNSTEKKILTVTFPGIELVGSNTSAVSDTKVVSVADIEDVLFGTWTGVFEYNVELVEITPVNTITFFIDGFECQAEEGMDWFAWADSSYFPQAEGDDDPPVMVNSWGVDYYYSGIAYNDTLVNPNDKILPVYYYTME